MNKEMVTRFNQFQTNSMIRRKVMNVEALEQISGFPLQKARVLKFLSN